MYSFLVKKEIHFHVNTYSLLRFTLRWLFCRERFPFSSLRQLVFSSTFQKTMLWGSVVTYKTYERILSFSFNDPAGVLRHPFNHRIFWGIEMKNCNISRFSFLTKKTCFAIVNSFLSEWLLCSSNLSRETYIHGVKFVVND